MITSDLFFFLTNGSARGTYRNARELVAAGSHHARLAWGRAQMRDNRTKHLVYWSPAGLDEEESLGWDDLAALSPESIYVQDLAEALRVHKQAVPDGVLCVYLPSPWSCADVRYAAINKDRLLLRSALMRVLRYVGAADWLAFDATSSWDAPHAWVLHEIAAMGFQVLVEGSPARSHPHLQAFGCYLTAKHLWKIDPRFVDTFDPCDCVGPVILQHDGTTSDPDAPETWPGSAPWVRNGFETMRQSKRGVMQTYLAIGYSETSAAKAMGLTAQAPAMPIENAPMPK